MLPEEEQRLRVLMAQAQRLPLPPEELFKRFKAPKRTKRLEGSGYVRPRALVSSQLPRGAVERFYKKRAPIRQRAPKEVKEKRPVGRPKKVRQIEDDPSKYQIIPYEG